MSARSTTRGVVTIVGAIAMLTAACSSPAPETEATAAPDTIISTTIAVTATEVPAPTTTLAPTTTRSTTSSTTDTEPPRVFPDHQIGTPIPLLVAGTTETVYLRADGDSETVITAGVHRAFDDGDGGLVFQITDIHDGERIWWVPRGSNRPLDVLAPSAGHQISLWGVDPGSNSIIYVRWEGDHPDDVRATLRTFSLNEREVAEHGVVGGWEWGPGSISHHAGVFVMQTYAEATSAVTLLDTVGDIEPHYDFTRILDPQFDERRWEYPAFDGERLAYVSWEEPNDLGWIIDLVVVDGPEFDEIHRVSLLRPDQGWLPAGLVYNDPYLILNRRQPTADLPDAAPALIVEVDTGIVWEVPVAGWADPVLGQPVTVTDIALP